MKRKILVSGIGLVLFILLMQTLNVTAQTGANCGKAADGVCCVSGSACGCLLEEQQ